MIREITLEYAERNIICFHHKDNERIKFYWAPMRRCVYWWDGHAEQWCESHYVPKQVSGFIRNGSWVQTEPGIPASALKKWLP